jgi:hypothetical protein
MFSVKFFRFVCVCPLVDLASEMQTKISIFIPLFGRLLQRATPAIGQVSEKQSHDGMTD